MSVIEFPSNRAKTRLPEGDIPCLKASFVASERRRTAEAGSKPDLIVAIGGFVGYLMDFVFEAASLAPRYLLGALRAVGRQVLVRFRRR